MSATGKGASVAAAGWAVTTRSEHIGDVSEGAYELTQGLQQGIGWTKQLFWDNNEAEALRPVEECAMALENDGDKDDCDVSDAEGLHDFAMQTLGTDYNVIERFEDGEEVIEEFGPDDPSFFMDVQAAVADQRADYQIEDAQGIGQGFGVVALVLCVAAIWSWLKR